VLQCVAVRCSVLQCVAVCCSVLQCVAVHTRGALQDKVVRCALFVVRGDLFVVGCALFVVRGALFRSGL